MSTVSSHYDVARFGAEVVRFSPRQSDVLIVAGTIIDKMAPGPEEDLRPDGRAASGSSRWAPAPPRAASTAPTTSMQGIDEIIPVDVYVAGLPADAGGADLRHPPAQGEGSTATASHDSAKQGAADLRRHPGEDSERVNAGARHCLSRQRPRVREPATIRRSSRGAASIVPQEGLDQPTWIVSRDDPLRRRPRAARQPADPVRPAARPLRRRLPRPRGALRRGLPPLLAPARRRACASRCRWREDDAVLPSLIAGVEGGRTGSSARCSTCTASTSTGHPNLRRILSHEAFQGHPLRKDYDPAQRWILTEDKIYKPQFDPPVRRRRRGRHVRAHDAQHRPVPPGHARHLPADRGARRRDDHRRGHRDRLSAPLLREDVGDAHLAAGHPVHRPAQLLLGDSSTTSATAGRSRSCSASRCRRRRCGRG